MVVKKIDNFQQIVEDNYNKNYQKTYKLEEEI